MSTLHEDTSNDFCGKCCFSFCERTNIQKKLLLVKLLQLEWRVQLLGRKEFKKVINRRGIPLINLLQKTGECSFRAIAAGGAAVAGLDSAAFRKERSSNYYYYYYYYYYKDKQHVADEPIAAAVESKLSGAIYPS